MNIMNESESVPVRKDNKTIWVVGNKLHRIDGPAVEWDDGDKEWCINGLFHREDGPAIDYINGHQEWWLNGDKQTFSNWLEKTDSLKNSNKHMIMQQLLKIISMHGNLANTEIGNILFELKHAEIHWPELDVIEKYIAKDKI